MRYPIVALLAANVQFGVARFCSRRKAGPVTSAVLQNVRGCTCEEMLRQQ